jgi:hypothetical protein
MTVARWKLLNEQVNTVRLTMPTAACLPACLPGSQVQSLDGQLGITANELAQKDGLLEAARWARACCRM